MTLAQPTELDEQPTTQPARPVPVAAWAEQIGSPRPESARSRHLAHLGGLTAVTVLVAYLTWRLMFTLPAGGWNLSAAYLLIGFEALPIVGLVLKTVTVWNIDWPAPPPVTEVRNGLRLAVLIPTYNEPAEVIAPTIAAACAPAPAHETWVLDDGDRVWVSQLCESMGARYVSRPEHDHAKAGNLNHALAVMAAEDEAGTGGIDVIAVLDCDHVPLPAFLTATLGWFDDPELALVQGPQAFYNAGAFDDDGITGEQGLFFNVLMPARQYTGAWLLLAGLVLFLGARRIRAAAYATSRRNAHRVRLDVPVLIDGVAGELVDFSVGGAAVRFRSGTLPAVGLVELELPRTHSIKMSMARLPQQSDDYELASLQAVAGDWAAYEAMSLWLFHTPEGAVPGLPSGVPAVAVRQAG